jgi:SAM-dependent methyltransferase
MAQLVKKYIKGTYVLDAGCGDGVLTFVLALRGFRVNAQDASTNCVRHLSRKIKARGLTALISAKKTDLLALPEKNHTFDAVVCGEVLEHIKKDTQVIKEFYRVLKPGGICVASTPGKPHLWHEIDDISGHERRYTTEEFKKKFENAGFIVRECYYWGFPVNGLWHRLIFKPFILRKMTANTSVTQSKSFVATVVKSAYMQKIVSWVFEIDRLFDWTGLGEFILLVAQKRA